MVLSVSGVLVLGVIALLGFYLASTSIAPAIRQSTASVAGIISGIRF